MEYNPGGRMSKRARMIENIAAECFIGQAVHGVAEGKMVPRKKQDKN